MTNQTKRKLLPNIQIHVLYVYDYNEYNIFRGEAVDSNVQDQVQMAKELLGSLIDALRQKAREVYTLLKCY